MTKHKYADLLRYAADNADALFTSNLYSEAYDESNKPATIYIVLSYVGFDDWQIYKEPVTETIWYYRTGGELIPYEGAPDLEFWFMKITYIDGKPTKAEFAE